MLENKWSDDDNRIEEMAKERSAKRKGKNGKRNNKETVQVITKDLIRNLM